MRISLCCQWLPLVVYNYTIDIGRQQWLPSYHPHPPHTRQLRLGIIYKLAADYLISLLSICPNYWPPSLSTSGSDQRQRHKNWASYLNPLPNGSFSGTWTVDNQNIFVFGKMELLWKDLENIYSHFHNVSVSTVTELAGIPNTHYWRWEMTFNLTIYKTSLYNVPVGAYLRN